MKRRFPSFSQWKQIFKILKRREKIALSALFVLAIGSLAFLLGDFYVSHTRAVPAYGGTYTEGVVGQPRFINPIYGETNDIDRSLIDLVFSGLMTYDKNGQVVNDLAESYTISPDGKTYDFTLKKNILWQDGAPLTVDDVLFTIKTIQNSDYKSPLRANWVDVNVQKTSDTSLRFTLANPYNSFLENCTVKILPQHIWQNISPENFALSSYNLQPIGSGPFAFKSLGQTKSGFIGTITLASNRRYYQTPSFLGAISFQFFESKDDLVKAANSRKVDGFTLAALDNSQAQAAKDVKIGSGSQKFTTHSFSLPRYFAVFFNTQKNSLLSDPQVRQALSYATNKDELVATLGNQTHEQIAAVDSPILPDFFGYPAPRITYPFDQTQAKNLLDEAGFKDAGSGQRQKTLNKKPAFQFRSYLKIGSRGSEVAELQQCLSRLDNSFKILLEGSTQGTFGKETDAAVTAFQQKYLPDAKPTGETGTATRAKLNELCTASPSSSQPLKFTLTTVNQPQLVAAANLLKNYWQQVGAQVDINAVNASDIKDIIKGRDYDALLYGEALGAEPDLYPFWYSSQKLDPGLNLSSYENKNADQLLQDARQTADPAVKAQKYDQLQNTILKDAPALFLYNPDYLYWVSQRIQGIDTQKIIDPAKRFSNSTNWYITTKRIWK